MGDSKITLKTQKIYAKRACSHLLTSDWKIFSKLTIDKDKLNIRWI